MRVHPVLYRQRISGHVSAVDRQDQVCSTLTAFQARRHARMQCGTRAWALPTGTSANSQFKKSCKQMMQV